MPRGQAALQVERQLLTTRSPANLEGLLRWLTWAQAAVPLSVQHARDHRADAIEWDATPADASI